MYGAIAYASDGSWGWAVDYTDQQSANNAAESQCGDCEVVLEFQNTCAAFALGDGGEGWASGDDPEEVQYAALDACSSVGTDCEVKNWACTSR
ncbi:MAG: DUF4189 domain-containing protein [Proteobacteria bacterium]|nr:DUF4189 domain-containing protein [Pseudomonadota bacterium]MBU1610670.1 DUF4189 domain-containing protein [Pseudomonadota bacterium]